MQAWSKQQVMLSILEQLNRRKQYTDLRIGHRFMAAMWSSVSPGTAFFNGSTDPSFSCACRTVTAPQCQTFDVKIALQHAFFAAICHNILTQGTKAQAVTRPCCAYT